MKSDMNTKRVIDCVGCSHSSSDNLYLSPLLNSSKVSLLTVLLLYGRFVTSDHRYTLIAFAFSIILWALLLVRSYTRTMHVEVLMWLMGGTVFGQIAASVSPLASIYYVMTLPVGIAFSSGRVRSVVPRILLLVASIWIVARFLLFDDSFNNIFADNSQNYVSVVLMGFSSALYLNDHLHGRRRPVVWPALLTLTLSLLATGRSGIIMSTAMLIVVVHQRAMNAGAVLKGVFVVALGTIMWVFLRTDIFSEADVFVRFAQRGLRSARLRIWAEFFSEMTIRRALLGFDMNELYWTNFFGGNPHNSYLRLWANTGFFAIPFVLFTFTAVFRLRVQSKFLFRIFVLLLLRAFWDIVFLTGWLDFILFFFIFWAYRPIAVTAGLNVISTRSTPCTPVKGQGMKTSWRYG